MSCARYVGRVGGLAVALGAGMAIALATPAVGSADAGSSTGASAGASNHNSRSADGGTASRSVRRAAANASSSSSAPSATAVLSRQVITTAHVAGGATGTPKTPASPAQALAAAAAEVVRREVANGARHASIIVTPTAAVVSTPVPVYGNGNLLLNPGAEFGDPSLSGYASVTLPGWDVTGTPTVIQYGTQRRLPGLFGTKGLLLPKFLSFPQQAPPGGDTQFFGGGNVATGTLTQTVSLGSNSAGLAFALSADLGGYLLDPSRASVKVNFLDASNGYISSADTGSVGALGRLLQTGLKTRSVTGVVPTGATQAQIVVTLQDNNPLLGNYNNAYADNVSFSVANNALNPGTIAVPASNVGALDHVFLVYMENHGTNDIIGSPNAPYINSLVNAYGYAQNYYALTHPSMPNYWPILGGSDFGLNYNCASQCFDEKNLISENPGLTWAAYQDGGGGYSSPNDRTPFLAFDNIYNDPTTAAKIKDISALAGDLSNPANVAQFNWVAADEATNMEGPINTLPGILNFALSQLTTHQYNVAAGDQFVQEQMSTIMNSSLWTSNEPSAVFLTFDEDYNNISFGIGNEGNHVVMVVIPNQAAIDSGMKGGAFVASDYYNHYSLQSTIEEALNLSPLTNNDKYAQPMNEFWV